MKQLSIKEMKDLNGGWIGHLAVKALVWVVYETLDDLKGSSEAFAQGVKSAPLKK